MSAQNKQLSGCESANDSRPYVDRGLIAKVKEKFPEAEGMTNTPFIDWALRKLLTMGA